MIKLIIKTFPPKVLDNLLFSGKEIVFKPIDRDLELGDSEFTGIRDLDSMKKFMIKYHISLRSLPLDDVAAPVLKGKVHIYNPESKNGEYSYCMGGDGEGGIILHEAQLKTLGTPLESICKDCWNRLHPKPKKGLAAIAEYTKRIAKVAQERHMKRLRAEERTKAEEALKKAKKPQENVTAGTARVRVYKLHIEHPETSTEDNIKCFCQNERDSVIISIEEALKRNVDELCKQCHKRCCHYRNKNSPYYRNNTKGNGVPQKEND